MLYYISNSVHKCYICQYNSPEFCSAEYWFNIRFTWTESFLQLVSIKTHVIRKSKFTLIPIILLYLLNIHPRGSLSLILIKSIARNRALQISGKESRPKKFSEKRRSKVFNIQLFYFSIKTKNCFVSFVFVITGFPKFSNPDSDLHSLLCASFVFYP